jgi:hypothetical protein
MNGSSFVINMSFNLEYIWSDQREGPLAIRYKTVDKALLSL